MINNDEFPSWFDNVSTPIRGWCALRWRFWDQSNVTMGVSMAVNLVFVARNLDGQANLRI